MDEENGETVIFRVPLNSIGNSLPEMHFYEEKVDGIVVFVHPEEKNLTYCFVFNINGIHRNAFINDDNSKDVFNYPKRLQTELGSLYKDKTCAARLYNSIFGHYFFIDQYK